MEHSHSGPELPGTSATALVLRLVLLLTAALVAGAGLVRPQGSRRVTIAVAVLAAVSALAAVISVLVVGINVYGAALHVVLVGAVPLLFGRPVVARWVSVALVALLVAETTVEGSGLQLVLDTAYVAGAVAWTGLAITGKVRSLVPVLGGVLVAAGVTRLAVSGLLVDRRIYESGLGLVLLAAVAVPLVATLVLAWSRRSFRYTAVGIGVALAAWSAAAAIPAPQELPVPGVPVLAGTSLAPVLISPHRPGRNLVHVPASAGHHLEVSVAGNPPVHTGPRAGAEGTWAEVDLPTGRSEVVIRSGARTASVDVDTGDQPGLEQAAGIDGPECTSAALGGLLAGTRDVLASCPADSLSTADDEALRRLVAFLSARGTPGITLAQDSSPRSIRAAEVIRASGLRVDTEQRQDNALVVVSGWSAAHDVLSAASVLQAEAPVYTHGLYVAPWLLNTPLALTVNTLSVPLRFDPREQAPVSYAVAVGNGFGGESPTLAGFRAWLGPTDESTVDGVQIYAVAQVTAMPMGPNEVHAPGMPMTEELAGQWIGKATVVPVSALLLG